MTPDSAAIRRRSNLTRSQFLFWLGQARYPESPLYNIPFAFHVSGALDLERLRHAFAAEVACNDALRTVVDVVDSVPIQRVVAGDAIDGRVQTALQLPVVDLRNESDPVTSAQNWLGERARTNLSPAKRLWDSAALIVADDGFIWYLNQHHIIADAFSSLRIRDRVIRAYTHPDQPLPEQGSFAACARNMQKHDDLSPQANPDLDQPAFYGSAARQSGPASDLVNVELSHAQVDALEQIAAGTGMLSTDLGLFCVHATLLASFVARTTNARRFAIGVPLQNRMDRAARETPGLFVDVMPLNIEVAPDDTFESLLRRVQANSLQMLRGAGDGSSTPRADCRVVMNFFNTPLANPVGPPVQTEWVHPGASDSEHKLRLHVHRYDRDAALKLQFEFNRGAFNDARQALALQHYRAILAAFLAQRDQQVLQVDLLTDGERTTFLQDFNRTGVAYDATSVLPLYHAQVDATPENIAVSEGKQTFSYRQLDRRAAALAHRLTSRGVTSGTLVPILLGRSAETIVAFLAVLKTGAAYLPLNPQEPPLRLAAILSDARRASNGQVGPLVSKTGLPEIDCGIERLDIDAQVHSDDDATFNNAERSSDDTAYVIYTSGSTGAPKGVVISDNSLANYLQWAREQYTDGPKDVAFHSSPAVDLTVTSIYLPLITGGRVEVFPDTRDSGEIPIADVFVADNVDVVKLTPAHLNIVRSLQGTASRIRTLILGGEDLKSAAVRGVLDKFPSATRIFNEYGPTEATVGCMIHRFDATRDQWTSVPIGNPIANASVYLLNESGQPVPEGVVGEICIGGAGVAKGYLAQSDETAARFVPDPFADGGTLYRSGDLGRWSPDGRLEFLGRTDHQAKIRGVRVETAEVQEAIQAHPAVDDCVVVLEQRALRHEVQHCRRCGIPSNHPDVVLDGRGVCSLCLAFDEFQAQALAYFKTPADFDALAAQIKAGNAGKYDCLALFSGGKDSTYMLYKLVERGLNPLAFTLDNGHVSDGAKANIARAVEDLGIDHIYGSTPHMPEIFADSLARYSNVCNGCFKTIYTLSVNLARQHGIGHIVTGLSRGQIFETRLHDLFRHRIFDPETIEQQIIDARKIYHRMDDTVAKVLDVGLFANDDIYTDIRFVDFYRYWDVPLDDVYAFLRDRAPWVRPQDTGRSTNCLINDAGIYVHKEERGFHNYALPYSWDVRLGHKTRDEALDELNDDIDVERVRNILQEVGYSEPAGAQPDDEQELLAYYVGDAVDSAAMRSFLAERLPTEMIPSHAIRIDEIPLTADGKTDMRKLPEVSKSLRQQAFVAPRNDLEQRLAEIWQQILGQERVGIEDNFFDIGGHSLPAIQVISRVSEAFEIDLPIRSFFNAPTIANVAETVENMLVEQIGQLSDAEVERQLTDVRHD